MENWEIMYRAKLEATLSDSKYYFDAGLKGLKLEASKAAAIELYVELRKEIMRPSQDLIVAELPNGLKYETISTDRVKEIIRDKMPELPEFSYYIVPGDRTKSRTFSYYDLPD